MAHTDPFQDSELMDTAGDVVIRFCEHDMYGSEKKAIAALRRRAPGYAPAVYEIVFNAMVRLLKTTIEVARPTQLANISPVSEDYDELEHQRVFAEIQQGIRERFSDHPENLQLTRFINWVHFWHHLK